MQPEKYSISHWIADVTEGLGPWTKLRVSKDLLQHYDEAYTLALKKGHSEDSAKALALASMGNTEEAHTRFSKAQLTVKEELRLAKFLRHARDNQFSAKIVYGVAICLFILGVVADDVSVFRGVAYLLLGAYLYLSRHFYNNGQLHRAQRYKCILTPLMLICMIMSTPQAFTHPYFLGFFLVLMVIALFTEKNMASIISKLPEQLSESDIQEILAGEGLEDRARRYIKD